MHDLNARGLRHLFAIGYLKMPVTIPRRDYHRFDVNPAIYQVLVYRLKQVSLLIGRFGSDKNGPRFFTCEIR